MIIMHNSLTAVCKNYAASAIRLLVMSKDSFNAKCNDAKVALFHKNVTSSQVKSSLYHEYFVT